MSFGPPPCVRQRLDHLVASFNTALATELADARDSLGVTVHELEVNALFDDVLTNPAAFGFTNVTDPAIDQDPSTIDPDSYLFWDALHSTIAAHTLLGDRAAAAVPEPATAVLLLLGMLLLAIPRRGAGRC